MRFHIPTSPTPPHPPHLLYLLLKPTKCMRLSRSFHLTACMNIMCKPSTASSAPIHYIIRHYRIGRCSAAVDDNAALRERIWSIRLCSFLLLLCSSLSWLPVQNSNLPAQKPVPCLALVAFAIERPMKLMIDRSMAGQEDSEE